MHYNQEQKFFSKWLILVNIPLKLFGSILFRPPVIKIDTSNEPLSFLELFFYKNYSIFAPIVEKSLQLLIDKW